MKRHIPDIITETEAAVTKACGVISHSEKYREIVKRLRAAESDLRTAKFYVNAAKTKDAAALVLPALLAAFDVYRAVGEEIKAASAEYTAWFHSRDTTPLDTSGIGKMISDYAASRPGSNWTGD